MKGLRIAAAASVLALVSGCGGGADNVVETNVLETVVVENTSDMGMDHANMAMGNAAAAAPANAEAELRNAEGKLAGTAVVTSGVTGLSVALNVTGLPAGEHGVHVHTVGRCDAPDFASAGSHWNPTAKQHGSDNPQGSHAGDLPNLTVGPDGTGTLTFTLAGGTLAGLLDSDGSAFVVHADKDDLKTDPSGNSGGRIACGVFAAK